MPRSPEDWDAWRPDSATLPARDLAADAAVRRALGSIRGRRTKTVADLGCGRGRLLPLLAASFGHVIAVDFAPETLARARRACAGLPVTFRRRDLRDLAPLRNRLDVAVAVDAVVGPRASDVARVLGEIASSLVEGGILVGSFRARPRRGREPVPLPLGDDEMETDLDGIPEFHETELEYRLRRAGFRGLRLRRVGTDGAEALVVAAVRRADN